MLLKVSIILLFAALLISLASGLFFLLKDRGESKRTLHSLGLRVGLTIALLTLVSYGVATGQLRSKAPWDAPRPAEPQQSNEP
ncbi:MAG: hypothetical protein ACI9GW_000848 [Halieaceae bacterium]|jgi:hypothetical protein